MDFHIIKQQNILSNMISCLSSILLKIIFNIIFITCKWVVVNEDVLKNNKKNSLLICIWHCNLVYFSQFFKKYNYPIWAISSTHKDSQILARVLRSWGIKLIKGSSTRGWFNVIKKMSALFINKKSSVIVTVDGPKGPAKIAKKGSVKIANKYNVPVLAASATSSAYWSLPSWDQTKIPKPFSTIYISFENHFFDQKNISSEKISKYINRNEKKLYQSINEPN